MKTFDLAATQVDTEYSEEFEVVGKDPVTSEILARETFTAYPRRIPPGMVARLGAFRVDNDSSAMYGVFERALGNEVTPGRVDGPYRRFVAFIEDPRYRIEATELAQILDWLIELSNEGVRPPVPSTP